jgi:diguanylate cyclase (GGDEF)-like protein
LNVSPTLESRLRALVRAQPAAPRALAVQAAGILLLAGGLLALLTVLLPPAAEGSEALILGCGLLAAVAGGVLLVSRPYIPDHGLSLVALGGTALIAIATHEGGSSGGTADNGILFLWVCLYSFYFLSMPQALTQMAVIGIAYVWLLTGEPGTAAEAATRWLVTMTSLLVAGLVIARLRGGVYRVVGELSLRASVDPLTGLLNRTSLLQRFEQERARSEGDGTPISVLAVDIDDFKPLNDSLGHTAGDRVLRLVSAALRHSTRRLDLVARLGGDELAVVLPGASADDARQVAEQIRTTVATAEGPRDVQVTVSIGVASAEAPVPAFDELWQAADSAMYIAKRRGGNGVQAFGEAGRELIGDVTRWDPRPSGAPAEVPAQGGH